MRPLLLCLAVLTGCLGLDFVSPAPVPTNLALTVTARHDSISRYALIATFRPGSDGDGRPYAIADSGLTADGGALVGVPMFDARGLQFTWERSVTPATVLRDSMVVVGPTMSTAAATITRVIVPLAARLDPRDLVLGAGGDLRLHVTPSSELGLPSTGTGNWQLTVGAQCDGGPSPVFITGIGAHPSEIVLSRAMLPADLPSPFEACFRGTAFFTPAGTPYTVRVLLFTEARWRVQLGP